MAIASRRSLYSPRAFSDEGDIACEVEFHSLYENIRWNGSVAFMISSYLMLYENKKPLRAFKHLVCISACIVASGIHMYRATNQSSCCVLRT